MTWRTLAACVISFSILLLGIFLYPMYTSVPPVASPSHTVLATVFWAGEGADQSNGFISNAGSFWDSTWAQRFGGVDDPDDRCGFRPCAFTPKENPFYVALPYAEYEPDSDVLKASVTRIPWFSSKSTEPLLKNRWIQVSYKGLTCYGQWQDVGPFLTDDFEYVFGTSSPSNTFGLRAGIDLSPAMRDCLGMTDNVVVTWRFVEERSVPAGPWKDIVTTSTLNWK